MQSRILGLNDVLRRLEVVGDRLVLENDMGSAQLSVLVKEDLELKYSVEIFLVD